MNVTYRGNRHYENVSPVASGRAFQRVIGNTSSRELTESSREEARVRRVSAIAATNGLSGVSEPMRSKRVRAILCSPESIRTDWVKGKVNTASNDGSREVEITVDQRTKVTVKTDQRTIELTVSTPAKTYTTTVGRSKDADEHLSIQAAFAFLRVELGIEKDSLRLSSLSDAMQLLSSAYRN